MRENHGVKFDDPLVPSLLEVAFLLNKPAIDDSVVKLMNRKGSTKEAQVASLLRAVTCLDLTTLCGDDCVSNVERLCFKAENPIQEDLLRHLGMQNEDIHVGAVCVYPARVKDCAKVFKSLGSKMHIAAVATGFPSGQYLMKTKLDEIEYAIQDGANEIDIVIDRHLALSGKWADLYEEVKQMKQICEGRACLKTIIAAGELGSFANIYRASITCMAAGADFIKTSTGKEVVNATLPIGTVMLRAIKDYFNATGFKVGFKPAGGIRTVKDVLSWQILMRKELGTEWLFPDLFRIGASGLLGDIEQHLFQYVYGYSGNRSMLPYP